MKQLTRLLPDAPAVLGVGVVALVAFGFLRSAHNLWREKVLAIVPAHHSLSRAEASLARAYSRFERALGGNDLLGVEQILRPIDQARQAVEDCADGKSGIAQLPGVATRDIDLLVELRTLSVNIGKFRYLVLQQWNTRDQDTESPAGVDRVRESYVGLSSQTGELSQRVLHDVVILLANQESLHWATVFSWGVLVMGILGLVVLGARGRMRVQERLRNERQMLTKVMDTSPVAIVVFERDGTASSVNQRAEALFGAPRERIVGRHHSDPDWRLADADGGALADDALPFNRISATGGPVADVNVSILRPDRRHALVSVSGAPLLGPDGKPDGVVLTMEDVTARMAPETAVREERDRAQMYLDIAGVIFLALNPRGEVTLINRKGCEILGYSEKELLGRDWFGTCIPERIRERARELFHGILGGETERAAYHESAVLTKSGGERIIGWHNTTVNNRRGRIVTVLGSGEDITDRARAEEALRESEERHRRVFEATGTAMVILEEDMTLSMANAELTRMTGYGREFLIGKDRWREAIHPDDLPLLEDHHRRRLDDPDSVPKQYECRFRTADGVTRHALLAVEFLADTRQSVISIVDVTERKLTEEALREREKEYRRIFEFSPEAIVVLNRSGRMVDVNRRVVDWLGYTPDELVGRNILQLPHLPWKSKVKGLRMFTQRMMGKEVPPYELTFVAKDGSEHIGLVRATAVRDDQDAIIGDLLMISNVTEQKRREGVHLRLGTAVEQAAESIIITDSDGVIEYVNPAFEVVSGYPKSDVIGKTPGFLKSGEHEHVFFRQMWATLRAGHVWQGRMTNRRADGGLYQVESTISPVHDGTGATINFVAVQRDVTQELALQERLQQAGRMEAVGQLAGGVAHDFNNLLMVISNCARFAKESLPPTFPAVEDIDEIMMATQRARDLTRQLLAFSRRQVLAPKVTDLNKVVEGVQKMLRRIIGENIKLVFKPDEAIGNVEVDPAQTEQIIVNFAVNARDAMPKGGTLTITTENVSLSMDDQVRFVDAGDVVPGDYVMVRIRDTGEGMSEDVRRRVFEPFFTTKPRGRGTGLGLSTVYGIVKQHRGHISLESIPGEGTAFVVVFPRLGDDVPLPDESLDDEGDVPGGTETLLVVEDDPSVRDVAVRMLEGLGYKVYQAGSFGEGVEIVRERGSELDLLLTDVILPDVDGKALADRARLDMPDLKVVFMSGYTADKLAEHGLQDRTEILIQKPFDRGDLARTIRSVLDCTMDPDILTV